MEKTNVPFKKVKYCLHNKKSLDHGFKYFSQKEWGDFIEKIKKDRQFIRKLEQNKKTKELLKDFLETQKGQDDICLLYIKDIMMKSLQLDLSIV
jgi:hypothetical protein